MAYRTDHKHETTNTSEHETDVTSAPPSRPASSAAGDDTRRYVASALLGGISPLMRQKMQTNEKMESFTLPPPPHSPSKSALSSLGREGLKNPKYLREPLLNLGELVVEGALNEGMEDEATREHGVFESFFDLTQPRLKAIFDALDSASKDQMDGVADFKHLRRGLIDAGVKVEDEGTFARLVKEVDQDLDGGLTFQEFESVVQSLKMAYLIKSRTPEEVMTSCYLVIPPNKRAEVEHLYALDTSSENGGSEDEDFVTTIPNTRVLDYGVAKVLTRSPIDYDSLLAFYYGARPEWTTTRWIDVTSPAEFIVKGLAVKYRLHPLSLEDALHNEYDQGAKLDRYDNHMFLIFPGMTLENFEDIPVTSEEAKRSRFWRRKRSKYAGIHRLASQGRTGENSFLNTEGALQPLLSKSSSQNLNRSASMRSIKKHQQSWWDWFWARKGDRPAIKRRTVVVEVENKEHANDFLGDDNDDTLHVLATFPGVKHYNVCIFLTTPEMDTLITIVDMNAGGDAVFSRVRKELQVSYSRLRSQNALFLMYTVLDVIVDNYSPVMDSLERHLTALRIEVRENAMKREILFDAKIDTEFLARYHDVLHELTRAKRRISPAIRVLNHLTNADIVDSECRIYLRDVQDHAEEFLERLGEFCLAASFWY